MTDLWAVAWVGQGATNQVLITPRPPDGSDVPTEANTDVAIYPAEPWERDAALRRAGWEVLQWHSHGRFPLVWGEVRRTGRRPPEPVTDGVIELGAILRDR